VKLSHSLFALPFAAAAVVLVARQATLSIQRLVLVAVAVVAARTAAMAMNRIADRWYDAKNPRTRRRELVTGEVSPRAAWALLAGSAAAFVVSAALISELCGWLSLPVLGILLGYSYAKRFTWGCHLWLGVAQALAPIGVAIALTGTAPLASVVLGLGVGAWILHVAAVVGVAAAGPLAHRGAGWLAGTAILAAVVTAEHAYVAPRGALRPERINVAFFNYNAFASIAFALCALVDLALS